MAKLRPPVADPKEIPAPPSISASKAIFHRATQIGGISWSAKFKTTCELRDYGTGFNSVDVMRVINRGRIVHGPVFDAKCNSWAYEITDHVEGRCFVVKILLRFNQDFELYPLICVGSAYFGKPRRSK